MASMTKITLVVLVVTLYIGHGDCLLGNGEICKAQNDCKSTMTCAQVAGVADKCTVKTCQCLQGQELKEGACTSVNKLGDTCEADATKCPSNSECAETTCKCRSTHTPDQHNTYKCNLIISGELHSPCDPTATTSVCKLAVGFMCNTKTSKCDCKPGHLYQKAGTCLPDPKGTVEQCVVSADCGASILHHYTCVSKRCKCPKAYKYNPKSGGCMPDEGYPCTDSYGCATGLICRNQECNCRLGQILLNQGQVTTCVMSVTGTVAPNGICEDDGSQKKSCKPGLTCVNCGPLKMCLDIGDGYSGVSFPLPQYPPSLFLITAAILVIP